MTILPLYQTYISASITWYVARQSHAFGVCSMTIRHTPVSPHAIVYGF